MRVSCIEFETSKTVQECASTFRDAVEASCSGGGKATRAVGMVRGGLTGDADSNSNGIEFFTPDSSPLGTVNGGPAWSAGVMVPGCGNLDGGKLDGPRPLGVQIYVVDHGATREVQVIGPYGTEDKGSTARLLRNIASRF
jgi:hypothetical protein